MNEGRCFHCAFSSTNFRWLEGDETRIRFKARAEPTYVLKCYRWGALVLGTDDGCAPASPDWLNVPDGYVHRDLYAPEV
jgi:hypothetical protein